MPEARDRRVQSEDIADVYIRRRRSLIRYRDGGSSDSSSRSAIEVLVDQPEEATLTPRRGADGAVGEGSLGRVVRRVSGSGSFGTPRNLRGRSFLGSPFSIGSGSENVFPGSSRGRASGSVLPYWYRRRPLQDITSVLRPIERRRARVGEDEGQTSESPMPGLAAHFEHDISMITPNPTFSRKPFPLTALRVPKILLDISNENTEESEFLTPQKKLLNSIDTVEKVVMEELNKLKRTPTARKVEREKRVRTLMSMR